MLVDDDEVDGAHDTHPLGPVESIPIRQYLDPFPGVAVAAGGADRSASGIADMVSSMLEP